MLDELLGRAELKDRIAELEDERDALEGRLEGESQRRKDAVRARQEAEVEVNRLEDRIEELEDRVERMGDDDDALDFRGTEDLRGGRLREVLRRLDSLETSPEGALTAAIPNERSLPSSVEDAFGDRAQLVRRATPCLALTDDAGLVSVALEPPRLPDGFDAWDDGFALEDDWFLPQSATKIALVRADLFALGSYEDGELVYQTGFESDVKSAHSKGGFSQARFERIREGQIDDHLDDCHEALDEHAADGDLVVLGERTVLGEFRDRATQTATVDASGEPREALEMAAHEFWTTRLYRL
ncbi:Vms1/Ankzf1 family peptidyl-tRNA hydrolase [Haloferax namakaokahaiae]|uniref:Vms1/Ankzf1 family peptidyl-tRNA hydrolase n=1 Tax=Haloferax namakaokahaiae TaxID=1748331 RepID=A0ABD5ZAX8_9EURY